VQLVHYYFVPSRISTQLISIALAIALACTEESLAVLDSHSRDTHELLSQNGGSEKCTSSISERLDLNIHEAAEQLNDKRRQVHFNAFLICAARVNTCF
jgi:hypothetical protein